MRLPPVLAAALLAATANAQDDFDYWPNAEYDPAIPSVESVLGYAPGARITWHKDVVRYFAALQSSQPGRVSLHHYATSWEGRELFYVVITSAENMARIDDIKRGMQSLRNAGNTSRTEADAIIQSGPAVTWLAYGIHGDEISSTEAAMLTAYHLLASQGDSRVGDILGNTIVVIDPVQNPDGRDRFIHHFEMSEGLAADPYRLAAEHDEPWPSGRVNHYLFDLNRDWIVLSQPETLGRIDALQEWFPVALIDAHEMGSDSTYFFAPGTTPYNPHLTTTQLEHHKLFGKTNASWFDKFGIDYFTRDTYDEFYPGYASSWPAFFGSISMTYEQASVSGLVLRQYDGNEISYPYAVRNHFVTSLGTAETVARNRQKFLQDFYDYQLSAIEEGNSDDIRAYILPTQPDQAGADKLAGLLVRQGVQVGVAAADFRACGKAYPQGSYFINLAQPAKRLVRSLMDTDVPMDDEFIAKQERRRTKALGHQMYDVTAWSLPLMMNVRADACNRSVSVNSTRAGPDLIQPAVLSGGEAKVAYLVPWGEGTAVRFLANALREGLAIKSSDEAFTNQGNRYASGTLIIDVADNGDSVHGTVRRVMEKSGADVVAVDDSWVTDGPSFGSSLVVRHNKPDVAIAWDLPTNTYSAGNTRFVIERQYDFPVTPIRTRRIATADLSEYEVLILPETWGAGYGPVLGEAGTQNLKDWVSNGGVLIALGNANRYVADANIDLSSIRRENAVIENNDENAEGESENEVEEELEVTVEGSYLSSDTEYETAITPETKDPDSVSGILVRAEVDTDHWLAAGVASTLNVLVRGSDIYTPIRLDSGTNVARFSSADQLLLSGYIWEENRRQLAYKPFAVVQPVDRGFVITFTQDPNIRAYLDGLNVIFMNAIFRGAAHARPMH